MASPAATASRFPIHRGAHSPLSLDELQALIYATGDALHAEKIILFGSYAYGTPQEGSDVDLLVIMETDAPRRERSATVAKLLGSESFTADLHVHTPAEIAHRLAIGDFFIRGIFIPLTADQMKEISKYAVQARYPGTDPTLEEAREALAITQGVRRYVRRLLGLK